MALRNAHMQGLILSMTILATEGAYKNPSRTRERSGMFCILEGKELVSNLVIKLLQRWTVPIYSAFPKELPGRRDKYLPIGSVRIGELVERPIDSD